MRIGNIRVFGEDFTLRRGEIETGEDGRFREIRLLSEALDSSLPALLEAAGAEDSPLRWDSGTESLDGRGMIAIPGLIDIHFHGCLGFDFCDGSIEAIGRIAEYEARNGVTAISPATLTLSEEELVHILETAAEYRKGAHSPEKADLVGINMEGPFISPVKKGAQNERYIVKFNEKTLDRFLTASGGLVRYVGIAPEENPEYEDCIRKARGRVKISLAHTNAGYDTAMKAYAAGASHAVHLYNAMTGLDHRDPGVVGATYASRHVMAELITDGVHIHPTMVQAAFRLLGAERIILISDSLRSTGMPDGEYMLGGQRIRKEGKRCALVSNGALAGSVSNVMDCMRTAVLEMGIPFPDAVRAASFNPAVSLGIEAEYGSISEGKKGNLVLLGEGLRTEAVIKDGRLIFR